MCPPGLNVSCEELVPSSSVSRLSLDDDGLGGGEDLLLFQACIALALQFVLVFTMEAAVSESLIFSA